MAIAALVVISPDVSAFGIRPARQTFTFVPNAEFSSQFVVVTDSNIEGTARLVAGGDLAPYISFDDEFITMTGPETSIHYNLKLPDTLPAGEHVGTILIEQTLQPGGALGAKVRIAYKIYVNSDQPHKGIEATLDALPHDPPEIQESSIEVVDLAEYKERAGKAEQPTALPSTIPFVGLIALLVFNLLLITFILLKIIRKKQ